MRDSNDREHRPRRLWSHDPDGGVVWLTVCCDFCDVRIAAQSYDAATFSPVQEASERWLVEQALEAHVGRVNLALLDEPPRISWRMPQQRGKVIDSGGGLVVVLVDRDLDRYPPLGTEVYW